MGEVSDAIREHHRSLISTLAEQVAALTEGRPEGNMQRLVVFLNDDLLPHARGEEKNLYPVMDALVKDYGQATATMRVDHEFIERYIHQIAETVAALQSAAEDQRPVLEACLRRYAMQLEAVLRVHLEKEERVYLPLFDRYLSDQEQQQVLDGMHAAYEP